MKEKMKGLFDRSSYTKLYIYVGIVVLAIILYLFVFRDTGSNKDSILLNKNETATVAIDTSRTQELTPEPVAPPTEQPVAPVTPTAPVEQPTVTPEPAQQPVQQPSQPQTTTTSANIPVVAENQIYANLPTEEFTVQSGQTAGRIFSRNQGDIFAMVSVNKAIENLGVNDKLYVKFNQQGKIVVLAIDKRRGGYVGQYILNIDN
ncbi:hypothetical protein CJP74_07955, partial [Psittacicella melopsittaci]